MEEGFRTLQRLCNWGSYIWQLVGDKDVNLSLAVNLRTGMHILLLTLHARNAKFGVTFHAENANVAFLVCKVTANFVFLVSKVTANFVFLQCEVTENLHFSHAKLQ